MTKLQHSFYGDCFEDFVVEKTKRINIDYAEEAKDSLWRYILRK